MAEFRDVRCSCDQRTLLAKVTRDPESGLPAIHVKALKRGARAPLEMYLLEGIAKVRCRDCQRWFVMSIADGKIAIRRLRETIDCESDSELPTVSANRYGNDSGTPFDT